MVAVGDKLKRFISSDSKEPRHPSNFFLAFKPGYETHPDFSGSNKDVTEVSADGKWVKFKAFPMYWAPVSGCEFETSGNVAIGFAATVKVGDKVKALKTDNIHLPRHPTLTTAVLFPYNFAYYIKTGLNAWEVTKVLHEHGRTWIYVKCMPSYIIQAEICEFESTIPVITTYSVKVGDKLKAFKLWSADHPTAPKGAQKPPRHSSKINLEFYPGHESAMKTLYGPKALDIIDVFQAEGSTWVSLACYPSYVIPVEACEFETFVPTSITTPVISSPSVIPVSRAYCVACGGYGKHRLMCPAGKAGVQV